MNVGHIAMLLKTHEVYYALLVIIFYNRSFELRLALYKLLFRNYTMFEPR